MTILSYKELKNRGIPYSQTHLYRLMKAGEFPQHIKFGVSANSRKGWLESDIDAWLQARIARRDRSAA